MFKKKLTIYIKYVHTQIDVNNSINLDKQSTEKEKSAFQNGLRTCVGKNNFSLIFFLFVYTSNIKLITFIALLCML